MNTSGFNTENNLSVSVQTNLIKTWFMQRPLCLDLQLIIMYKPVKQAFPKKQHVKYGSGVFRRVVGNLIKDVILASFCTKAIFDSSMQSYFKINFI